MKVESRGPAGPLGRVMGRTATPSETSSVGSWARVYVGGFLIWMAGCSGVSNSPTAPSSQVSTSAPVSLTATGGDGEITLTWSSVPEADGYTLYWDTDGDVSPATGEPIRRVTSPYVHRGLSNGQSYSYIVTATADGVESPGSGETQSAPAAVASAYFPAWGNAVPDEVIVLEHDGTRTDNQNGAALKAAIEGLTAGQRLEIESGTYSINSLTSFNLQGTSEAPIWVAAREGHTPVITRPNAGQNAMNVGSSGPTRFLVLEGLEITGGSAGLRLYDCEDVWVDRCEIHHTAEAALTANTRDTARLHITRNHIHHTLGTGEGMYLGANHSAYVMRDSVIAQNHVHDCAGSQGDGIEIKQGSFGNWVVENLVHDTHYPCILVYGTDGNPFNTVERNVCYNSDTNAMQVQGEAIVRNNLLVNGGVGFSSHDHQGSVRDLTVVHNTVINRGRGVNLSDWGGRPGMVFANNVVYSENSQSVRFGSGSSGVEFVGNVVSGPVVGISTGFIEGSGLADFAGLAWDASALDPTPEAQSAIIGSGDASWEVTRDLDGNERNLPLEAGCVDG